MDNFAYRAGDPVEKVGGDYAFEGTVVSVFQKLGGQVRLVVEDDRGVLHVYSEKNLRLKGAQVVRSTATGLYLSDLDGHMTENPEDALRFQDRKHAKEELPLNLRAHIGGFYELVAAPRYEEKDMLAEAG